LILAKYLELVGVYFCTLNSTFDLDRIKIWKYLDLLEDAKLIDRISIDRFYGALRIDRLIASRLIEVGSTESRSIDLFAVQIIDQSNCLRQFLYFQDQP
jgi:hypothetical protein